MTSSTFIFVGRNLKDFDQVEKEIQELEGILHSKAVTTTDAHSMSYTRHKSNRTTNILRAVSHGKM